MRGCIVDKGGHKKMATSLLKKQPTAHANYNNNLNEFHQEIINAGLTPPAKIIDDGQIHRFSSNGKRGDDAGWYRFYSDGVPAGSFGCFRLDMTQTWSSKSPDTMTPAEREARCKRMESAKIQLEAETIRRHAEAAAKAQKLWADAEPVDAEHPYLVNKNVHQHGLRHVDYKLIMRYGDDAPILRYMCDALIVPLYGGDDLASLQFITPDGSKRFLPGGKIKGSYSPIGEPQDGQKIYICEGWATGATIHQSTGCPVICAMSADNLLDVGRYLRCEFPHKELIIAADDDRKTKGNPGRKAAMEALRELNCKVVFPQFPDDAPMELSDFNDLQNWRDMQ